MLYTINAKKGENTVTAQELQKRSERAEKLRVLKVNDSTFFVESQEGKICYRVNVTEGDLSCSCGDFARGIKADDNFRCKHIIALENCRTDDVLETNYLEKKKPKLDERFITTVEGQEFVKYPGLLDLAHQKSLLKIEVEALQFPTKDNANVAICKATVVSKSGETFTDIGDANPLNCSSKVSKHLLRMASTRAIARALRSFTNIGMTCLEEVADFKDVEPAKPTKKTRKTSTKKSNGNGAKDKTDPKTKSTAKNDPDDKSGNTPDKENDGKKTSSEESTSSESKGPSMSEAQKRALMNLSRRRGISIEEVEKMSMEKYQLPLEELSSKSASEFIRHLQQAA
jgi:predicted nucleic acid-binding Zn finger protein